MNEDLDPVLATLARIAPATEAPPAPGSHRSDSILERAMSDTTHTTRTADTTDAEAPAPRGPDRRRAARWSIAAAVAVAAAIVAGVVVLEPGRHPLAQALDLAPGAAFQ